LELTPGVKKPPSPFKLNSNWLEDPSFIKEIKCHWIPYNSSLPKSPSLQFLKNIKKTKKVVIIWNFERRKKENQALLDIEQKL
jgi:hypothetical protein